MNVTFYNFSKKENSTKQPQNGVVKTCNLKYGCSIESPVLVLQGNDFGYNYFYIASFGKYYFVTNCVLNNGFCEYTGIVDVLASYKAQILAKTAYVERSASLADNGLGDSYFPLKSAKTVVYNELQNPFIHQLGEIVPDINRDGCFIVGVVSQFARYGSVDYRVMKMSALETLCQALLDDSLIQSEIDLNDASLILQKSILNPIQYIVSCIWVPFVYESFEDADFIPHTNLKVWTWTIQAENKRISALTMRSISGAIPLTMHPLAAYGNWLNAQPYTRTWLDFPVFGVIPIDSEIFTDSVSIEYRVLVDLITGQGKLYIYNGTTLAQTLYAQIGVSIQLSQVTKDYLGAIDSAASSIGAIAKSALHGNIAGAISSGISGAAGVVGDLVPAVSSIGNGGGFASFWGKIYAYRLFHEVAIDATGIAENGRALCKSVQLSTLTGYCKLNNKIADFDCDLTELQKINNYLTSGFYIE